MLASSAGGELDTSPDWRRKKAISELVCATSSCETALWLSQRIMPEGGDARRMMTHFLSGSAEPATVNLTRMLENNPELKQLVGSRIERDLALHVKAGRPIEDASGAIWVRQSDYGTSPEAIDQKYALGGTYFEYRVVGTSDDGGLQVQLNIADHYFWSPAEEGRATQCLHQCGEQLVIEGKAHEFTQLGEGQINVPHPASGLEVAVEPSHAAGAND